MRSGDCTSRSCGHARPGAAQRRQSPARRGPRPVARPTPCDQAVTHRRRKENVKPACWRRPAVRARSPSHWPEVACGRVREDPQIRSRLPIRSARWATRQRRPAGDRATRPDRVLMAPDGKRTDHAQASVAAGDYPDELGSLPYFLVQPVEHVARLAFSMGIAVCSAADRPTRPARALRPTADARSDP